MNDNRIDVSCVVIYACGAIARPRASDGTSTAHKKRSMWLCVPPARIYMGGRRKKTQPQN